MDNAQYPDSPDALEVKRLSILLPVHNGADAIGQVLTECYNSVALPTGAEMLVCEDGSTDGTGRVLGTLSKTLPIRYITDSRRKGYAAAVRDGLRYVNQDVVFFSDSDGQYAPREFWRLYPHIEGHDMVVGRKVRRSESYHRVLLSRGFHALARILFETPLSDIDCGFRLMRRELIEAVLPRVRSLPYSFWAEFTILALKMGYRIKEVPITHRPRLEGITTIYTPERLPHIIWRQLLGLRELRQRMKP